MNQQKEKGELFENLKIVMKFCKKDIEPKFDEFIKIIIKIINLIYNNPEKYLYNLEKNILIDFNLESDPKLLSKKIKENSDNKLLRLVIRVIYNLLNIIKGNKYILFSFNQKYIYLHLIRHLIKELMFEIPTDFKSNFSNIFKIQFEEISKIENFDILRALLVEIGDHQIINFELEKNNHKVLAHLFPYFIKAYQKKEIKLTENFDEIFENLIKNWLLTVNDEKSEISKKTFSGIFNFTNFFKKQNLKTLNEIDREIIIDFFTIYNIKDEYTQSDWFHFKVFSILFQWLTQIYKSKKNEKQIMIFKDISFETKEIIISYCLRLLSQSERKIECYKHYKEKNILMQLHKEYNEAIIAETIKILNILCKIDGTLIPKIVDYLIDAYERIVKNQSGLSFLELLQFLLDHEINILVDFEKPFKEFFCVHINNNYNNLILTTKILDFLFLNKEVLYKMTKVYQEYYPNIFRILIWSPLQFKRKFLELMNYFITKEQIFPHCTDLFHFILDLPLMAALLEYMDKYWDYCNGQVIALFDIDFHDTIKYIFRLDEFKNLLFYDQIEAKKLEILSSYLNKTSRIIAVCEIAPELLAKYFEISINKMSSENIILLSIDMFMRFSRIYDNLDYKKKVRETILIYLEKIFKNLPEIIFLLSEKILERISNFHEYENWDLNLTLCWAIGEFVQKDVELKEFQYSTIEIANKYCDALEIVIHEIVKDILDKIKKENYNWDYDNKYHLYLLRLIQLVINCLMKLAIKFKQFIPKVMLIFSKILSMKNCFKKNILSKVEENLNLLHYTSISSVLLTKNDIIKNNNLI